jgi:cyclopropane fatty-acyl-phospholipid synthase-like methyltransferase
MYDELAEEYERRADSLLPVTGSAIDYFSSYIKPGGSVLDVGCGVGIAMNVLSKKGLTVSGIEISPKMAEFAKKRNPGANVITGDLLGTEFDHKFDAVLAFAFIHLFPKAEVPKIFEKIRSVLKPGGVALLSSTESLESKEGFYTKEDFGKEYKRFRKFWTEQELRESFQKAGFKELALKKFTDPFGKIWMDFVVQK